MSAINMFNLKVGMHSYEITAEDEFMDNGSCVQLRSQSKEKSDWGRKPNPVLSKRAVKEMSSYSRIQKKHGYGDGVQVFNLAI